MPTRYFSLGRYKYPRGKGGGVGFCTLAYVIFQATNESGPDTTHSLEKRMPGSGNTALLLLFVSSARIMECGASNSDLITGHN